MENVKSENRIFEGFKPRIPLVLIFALGVLLGSLTPIFGEVPVFSGAALFVIASLVFMTAREILPVVGILCPALFAFMMTGELAAPALYIGVIFTVGATVYLTLGGRVWAPIACAAVAYALGAVAIDPISALPALIPVAVGLFAALMLPRQGLTFATAALTSIALTAGLSFFLASGGDLAAVADTVRESIANAYASLNSEFLIITEDTAKTLAAYIINISPGFIFAAASAVVFVSLSLANTLFRASGVGDKIPEEMAKLTLSPISGIIYLFCFFLSAAFMIEGTTVFNDHWNVEKTHAYADVELSSLPESIVIRLVDSLSSYHYPYKGRLSSRYGPRRGRPHQGVDLPLKVGDPIYAAFDGKVRYSKVAGNYGNLVVIRHNNGLETYYAHLSARSVEVGEWVVAGQQIGLGGNTGRSTGPHLHFEVRYRGQSFDPERIIDFSTGDMRRSELLLKRRYFSIYSKYEQDFDDEIEAEKQEEAERKAAAAVKYHTIRSGDTLGALARKYGTTVTRLCQLNGIKSTSILRIGQRLRVS